MIIQNIDKGNPFDWGKTSEDYAKYRDIYPQEFYDYILALGLCKNGQKVLDIDTVHPVWVPDGYLQYFDLVSQNEFRVDVPFTRYSAQRRAAIREIVEITILPDKQSEVLWTDHF